MQHAVADDAYVDRRDRDGNFGDERTLRYDRRGGVYALLRFDLSDLPRDDLRRGGGRKDGGGGPSLSATLSLYPADQACRVPATVEVLDTRFDDDWTERDVTYGTSPKMVGPRSAQPRAMAWRDPGGKRRYDAADVTRSVLWAAEVRGQSHVTFRLRGDDVGGGGGDDDESCELASKEYRRGGKYYGPRLEVRYDDDDDDRDGKKASWPIQPRPEAWKKKARADGGGGGTHYDGILFQGLGDPCVLERYLDGETECFAGLVCWHPDGETVGFGTCQRVGEYAGMNGRCDASFGATACEDNGWECLASDGSDLNGIGTGRCKYGLVDARALPPPPPPPPSPPKQQEVVTEYTTYRESAPRPPPLPPTTQVRRVGWFVDYSLGTQGQCTMSCILPNGRLCNGEPAEEWDETFANAEVCCEQKLWWMPLKQCVPDLF